MEALEESSTRSKREEIIIECIIRKIIIIIIVDLDTSLDVSAHIGQLKCKSRFTPIHQWADQRTYRHK